MRKILAIIILIMLLSIGCLATLASGYNTSDIGDVRTSSREQVIISSDTKWTVANSPYIITGNVLVEEDATLTIQPGVEVRFDGFYYIKVEGKLVAKGTQDQMINFTSNKTTPATMDWKEISFEVNGKESIFEFCRIEYGASPIISYGPSLIINSSIFTKNGRAINIFSNTSIITNNK